MSDVILSCAGIHKTFREQIVPSAMLQDAILRRKIHREPWQMDVLKDVSVSVRRGEWVGLYGHNGAGKTTLLRILAGLMRPDKGTVNREGSISCFFELGVGFHPERTAVENIYLHGLLHGMSPSEIGKVTESIIDFAGVSSHRHLPVKSYSTGMGMRLAFAAATYVKSDIFLFDEILAVGDWEFQQKCKAYLHSLKKEGGTAVMVNHDLPDLRQICDRILFIENGAVVGEEIVSRP
jgi:ABC-type polysaccharide/polyol phosphate transport system ATPase subunit